jgi:predicted Zn finger-like uncharacterized protein
MLKVECESCKAPYQIDERRVPAAGLKMRCPKCGHSFVVKNPAAAGAGAPEAPAKPAGPPPPPRVAARPAAAAPVPPPAPAPAPPKPPPPAPKAASMPAALSIGDLDLPAVAADLPAPAAPAPKPHAPSVQKRTMMGVPGPANSPGGSPRIVKAATPAFAAPAPAPAKPDFDLGLDAPDFADLPSPAADLPSAARPAPPKPPARVAPKATMAFGADPFGEADLPSPALDDLPSPANIGLPAPANVGLPAAAKVGLPSAAARQPMPPKRATVAFGEIDLPTAAQDLPAIANALPAVAQALPAVAQALPSVAQALPSVAQSLPVPMPNAHHLPTPAAEPDFGAGDSLPPAFGGGGGGGGGGDDFGELELPRAPLNDPPAARGFGDVGFGESPHVPPVPRAASPVTSLFDENPFSSVAPPKAGGGADDGGFGELELPVPPQETQGHSFADPLPQSERGSVGGMAFGELDLGGGATPSQMPGGNSLGDNPFGEASLGSVIQPPPAPTGVELSRVASFGSLEGADARASGSEGFGAPADASLDGGPRVRRERGANVQHKPLPWMAIIGVVLGVIILGGVGTTFTRLGPFGYSFFFDTTHAAEYARLADAALQTVHQGLSTDMFADAKAVSDAVAAQRAAKPRARALTAVAAIAELETEMRFGKDPDRANRVKVWLTTEIPEPRTPDKVKYLDVALAAVSALDREKDKARAGFDAAAHKYGSDPIQQDIAFLRGELELRSGEGPAATAAFAKAL